MSPQNCSVPGTDSNRAVSSSSGFEVSKGRWREFAADSGIRFDIHLWRGNNGGRKLLLTRDLHPNPNAAIPVTKEQRQATATSVVRDVVGADLMSLYVTTRHPLSGARLDDLALVVIVDAHRAEGRSYVSELTEEIPKRTGVYHEVFVYAAEERDNLALRDGTCWI